MRAALRYAMPIELRWLLALASTSALAALLLATAVMFLRRAAFEVEGVSPWLLFSAAVLTAAAAIALRELAWFAAEPQGGWRLVASLMATAVMVLAALANSLAPASLAGVVLIWLAIAGEEAWHWSAAWGARPFTAANLRKMFRRPAADGQNAADRTAIRPVMVDESPEQESAELLPADVLQQLTRSRGEAGGEVIYALLRAEFAVGDRQQWLNVAFCPPLQMRPACSVHFAEGDAGVLEVEEVETYGVRVVVRLPRPAAAQHSVLVELFAESPAGA